MSYLSDSNTQIVLTPEQETTLDSLTGLDTTPAGEAIAKKADGTFENVAVHNGDVVSVAVATANGLAGTSDGNQSNPTLTLSTTVTGLLKGNGTAISSATAGTDYAPATSGTSILKGNGTGGFSNAVSSTDYAPATIGTSVLAGNGTGGFTNLTPSQTQADLSETNTSSLNYVKNQSALKVNVPQGFMLNGKIVTSVASGTLWISIKTLAGTDPSATDPVYVRIGDTVRTISSAKVVYEGAGQNSLNLGSTELATFETDLFLYLVWNSVDSSIRMFASRINHGRVISDFVISTTDPRGVILQDNPSWNATDQVEVIGRFNVALSGGAGYTWSIPATSVIINRPIYETRQLTFQPVWTADTTNPAIGNGYLNGSYKLVGTQNIVNIRSGFGSTTTYGTGIYQWSLPFTYAQANLYQIMSGTGSYYNGTSFPLTPHNNYFFGGGGVSVTTPVAATSGVMSASNPVTLANGEYFGFSWTYNIV